MATGVEFEGVLPGPKFRPPQGTRGTRPPYLFGFGHRRGTLVVGVSEPGVVTWSPCWWGRVVG